MRGSYAKLNKIREQINNHQWNPNTHSYTCGNDARHIELFPRIELLSETEDLFELKLCCANCYWEQEVPAHFFPVEGFDASTLIFEETSVSEKEIPMKIKLFTHTDYDGVGCAVVGKFVYKDDIDVTYCDYHNVNEIINNYLKHNVIADFDKTFITDISVDEVVAHDLNVYVKHGHNVTLLDHHATAMWLNKYEWAEVHPEHADGTKSAGTSMFFDYLNQPSALAIFVENVRRWDTWEWTTKYNDEHAKVMNALLHLIGRDRFVTRFSVDPSIQLRDAEQILMDIEQARIKAYIGKKAKNLIEREWNNYLVGVVYAEQYISELGNELAKKNPHLDFIMIINMGAKTLSFRSIKDDIDLGKDVAASFGGGGHPKAAGAQIDDSMMKIISTLVFANGDKA